MVKKKTQITWPIFNYFIKEEEEEYRLDIISKETKLEKKTENISKTNIDNYDLSEDLRVESKDNNIRKWLSYNNFSCRFDCFFLIFTFLITNKIANIKDKIFNNYIEFYNTISEEHQFGTILNSIK